MKRKAKSTLVKQSINVDLLLRGAILELTLLLNKVKKKCINKRTYSKNTRNGKYIKYEKNKTEI